MDTTLKPTKAIRSSNIELYRIISMLLIIAHHYVVNSGLTGEGSLLYTNMTSPPSIFLFLFGAWGKTGINCFVLITGYFMCKSKISARKFAKLYFEVMFYRLILNGIFWFTGYAPFTFISLMKVLLPLTSVAQNFTGTYLIFFLCIPFLNILIHNMNEKQHIRLLILMTFTYVLFGTIPTFSVSMNYVSWYTVLFLISSYVRLYPKKIFDSKKFWGILSLFSVLLSAVSVVACTWLGEKIGLAISYAFVADSNTFLAVLTGLSSFMFFKNLTIKPNKIINTISATTFGVLLIHANSSTMRRWLWGDVLNNTGLYHSPWMPVHAIGSVLLVFCLCSVIDMARIRWIEKPFFNFWDKHWDSVATKWAVWENRLCKKLKIETAEK